MTLYEADFYLWTRETAERLQRGAFAEIDIPALVDELEDLGSRQKSALQTRVSVLIAHLLRWDSLPAKRSGTWQATIELQRIRVKRLLRQSPSLRPVVSQDLAAIYSQAVLRAIKDTGLDRSSFAATCPYTLEEILSAKNLTAGC